MPVPNEQPRALPGLPAAEKLSRREVLRAGTSPFNRDKPPSPQPDTSRVVACPQCRARFIGIGERSAEANLAART